MWRFVTLVVVGMIILLLLSGCSLSPASTIQLTEKDAGRTVEMRSNDRLEVTLEGNPTTGYGWEVSAVDTAVLKPVGEPQFKADSSLLGSGGKVTLTFGAVSVGKTPLKLVYLRPFEKGVPPLKSYEVTVVVK